MGTSPDMLIVFIGVVGDAVVVCETVDVCETVVAGKAVVVCKSVVVGEVVVVVETFVVSDVEDETYSADVGIESDAFPGITEL